MSSTKKTALIVLGVGVVLFAVGVFCWLQQSATGVPANTDFPFGIYLTLFFCCAGSAAGFLFAGCAADFGLLPELAEKRRALYSAAVALLVAAGLVIAFLDCGQPLRVLGMITGASANSLVSWDFFFLLGCFVISVVCLFVRNRWVSLLAALLGLGVVVIEALILVVTAGMEHWNNPMLVATFITDAFVLAFGLVVIASNADACRVRPVIAVALLLTLVITLADLVAGLYGQELSSQILCSGQFAGLYWTMVVLGLAVPGVALLVPALPAVGAKVAAALAVAGVFLSKLVTIVAGEAITVHGTVAIWAPEALEFGCALGGIGVALLVFALLMLAFAPKQAQ